MARFSPSGPRVTASLRRAPSGPVTVDGRVLPPSGPTVATVPPDPPDPGPVDVPPGHEWGFAVPEAVMDLTGEPPGDWTLELSSDNPVASDGHVFTLTVPPFVVITFEGPVTSYVDDALGAYARTYTCTVRLVPTTDNTVVYVVVVEESVVTHNLSGIYSYLPGWNLVNGDWTIEDVAGGLLDNGVNIPVAAVGPFNPVDIVGAAIPDVTVAETVAVGYQRTSTVAVDALETLTRVVPGETTSGAGLVVWQTGLGDAPRPTPGASVGGGSMLVGQNGEGGTETAVPLVPGPAGRINDTDGTFASMRQIWGSGAALNDVVLVGPVTTADGPKRVYVGTANEGGFQSAGGQIAEILAYQLAAGARLEAWRRHGAHPRPPAAAGTLVVLVGASDMYEQLAAQLIALGECDTVLRFALGGETVTNISQQVLAVRQCVPWIRQYTDVRIYMGAGIISNEWVLNEVDTLASLYESADLSLAIRTLSRWGRFYWAQHTFRRTAAPVGGREFTLAENEECHLRDQELCAREQIALVPWVHSVLLPGEWERTISDPAPVAFPDRVHWSAGGCASAVLGPFRSARLRWGV